MRKAGRKDEEGEDRKTLMRKADRQEDEEKGEENKL